MNIRSLAPAVDDLDRGRRFYDLQGQGLGVYFLDSLFSDIDSLTLYAGIHPVVFGYFRLLSKRFPYAVYYRLDDGDVLVWRVLDLRQNPVTTQRALR